jgi:hypothetical protein
VVYSEYDLVFPIALLRELIGNYIEPKFVEFAPRATESDNDAFRWVDRIIESRSGLEWRKIYSQFTTNLINDGDIKNIPIQFHLDTSDPEVIQEVEEKIFKICELINFHPFVLLPGVKGSWLRRLVGRTHKFFTSKEVIEKVNEVEHAIKLHTIGKQQSEIDKNLAEGVSALIVSTKDIPNVAIQLGSLLFVKVTLPNGEPVISTRSLTIKEMIYLANNPGIISQPKHILEALQKNCLDLTGNGIQDQLLKL